MPDDFRKLHDRAIESEHRLRRTSLKKQYDLKELLEECSALFREMSPIKRKVFLSHVVQDLYEKQGGICPLCREPVSLDEFDVDHIVPWYWGGGNEKGNLQITHYSCNRSKGSKVQDIHELVEYLEDRIMNF